MYHTRKYVQQISLCAVFLLSFLYFGFAGTSPAGVERGRNSAIASVLVLEKRALPHFRWVQRFIQRETI